MIYLATPYTHDDPAVMEQRFRDACRVAGAMMARGEHVFSPIAHTHTIALLNNLPQGWEFWDAYDRHMIGLCDEVVVVMMPGWDSSKGVGAEILIAVQLGKPFRFVEFEAEA